MLRDTYALRFASFEVAILNIPLLVASGSFTSNSIQFGLTVYENGGVAVEILSLSCIAAKILQGSYSSSPYSRRTSVK